MRTLIEQPTIKTKVATSAHEAEPDRPHVAEFVAELSDYLADDSIVLTGVMDEAFGRVDVVVVGRGANIGFVFGRWPREGMPYFLSELYVVRATDVAHGAADILYVAARDFAAAFQPDARLRLAAFCSERVLSWRGHRQGVITARGDDGQPFVIRVGSFRRVQRGARSAVGRREARPSSRRLSSPSLELSSL